MGYIGQTPTAVPLDGDDLSDDIITLAKMASGTDGNIITYDASGNPAAVATGTDGQVLTSTGAGSAPAFEANAAADTSLSNLVAAGGQQVVKVWINFNGTGTVAIRDSYNVTSITDNATGDYTVTIATDFANINYSIASPSAFIATGAPQHHTVFNRINSSGAESAPTVTAFRMTTSMDGVSTDAKYVYASAFGD